MRHRRLARVLVPVSTSTCRTRCTWACCSKMGLWADRRTRRTPSRERQGRGSTPGPTPCCNPPRRRPADLAPFWFGCVAGAAPWVAITVNLVGSDDVPTFVYVIFFSLFAFFMSFAVNQWLQYRQIGPWRDYGFGESVYLVLSLLAKSALAWQIVAGSLA